VWTAALPFEAIQSDFEYFAQVVTDNGRTLQFPAAAPEMNQTAIAVEGNGTASGRGQVLAQLTGCSVRKERSRLAHLRQEASSGILSVAANVDLVKGSPHRA
jgi:hypothetical protein